MTSLDIDIEAKPLTTTIHALSSLSWHNISFSTPTKQILTSISAHVPRGEILAILGSSGSGKTTLLNILAQRNQNGGKTTIGGDMWVNGGVRLTGEVVREVGTYVEQEDALLGSLTVRETLEFAARLALPDLSRALRAERVTTLLRAFGLTEQADTQIGTALARRKGISGGQKRRVSVACQIISMPRLVFLDEPTSGLDSAASREVISHLQSFARAHGMIIVCSIHQPSSATFGLFDKTLLLSRGKQIYFGRVGEVEEYFHRIGKPVGKGVGIADHMLDVTNVDFWGDEEEGNRHVEEMANAWSSSPEASTLEHLLTAPSPASASHLPRSSSRNHHSTFWHQILTLTHRTLLKSYRDPLAYTIRFFMYLALALLMGTTFLRLPATQSSLQSLTNAIFFGGAFMSFMQVAAIPSVLEDLVMWGREGTGRGGGEGLYGPGALLVSGGVVGVGFLGGIVVVVGVVSYWMIGFQPTAVGFWKYVMWLFLDLYAAESLVVLISAIIPIFVGALTITAFVNGLFMAVGGFLVSPNQLNVFWRYTFRYIDYQRYVFEGMMKNEFANRRYSCEGQRCIYDNPLAGEGYISGQTFLDQNGYGNVNEGKWVAVLLGIILGMKLLTWVILKAKK
ncbi:P-loop containing nucleoside triphosphate hydrolase protein [Saitoella complicata NRRL Y-17804]|uniref:P-loop containing nucleoside triphosphate hydrolase protein n=1 Tax=Saitoella complicata (strain BCRC 22490 / CBS 7301 / JCM 7358 / NBRC 10748 / NRRL Y-17804) TaxID=698492 RepID=UPI000866B1E2|nr:P-loop containing nucleoside triphosphate hydrolase protein [Saitoella complicata NRRL Y-17804]ODQ51217.1 P-loop containing nucleoside triphosphate hydrolase protein [Saitoella complicata NRRL Y-17804]